MSIRDEIVPYVDGDGLIAPWISNGQWKSSDNGVIYSSEYYVMLQKLGQLVPQDLVDFDAKMKSCLNPEGMLCRVPQPVQDGQEGPDDYFGLMNACKQLGNTEIPRTILWSLIKHFGFLNNDSPGTITGAAFMARFGQLTACMVSAAFPSWKNPLHILARLVAHPLYVYSAILLLLGDMFTDASDTDSRRLSWHQWQCLKGSSLLCWLGGKVWAARLYGAYGPTGMQAVAKIYYQAGHPFAKYWVTE